MTIELQPQEYSAFQTWKVGFDKNEQHRISSLQSPKPIVIEAAYLLLRLAIEIQMTGKATAFARFYGHIQCVEFHVYNNGWKADGKPDFELDIYKHCQDDLDKIKSIIREKIGEMNIFTPEHLDLIINQ